MGELARDGFILLGEHDMNDNPMTGKRFKEAVSFLIVVTITLALVLLIYTGWA
jgi:hypothetical protein